MKKNPLFSIRAVLIYGLIFSGVKAGIDALDGKAFGRDQFLFFYSIFEGS